LSFIGGHQSADAKLGADGGENQQFIRSYWYLCVFPAVGIASIMPFTFSAMG
jgi:ABC-type dipeptide/oligopeptide/nickel transport system permease subunit